MKCFFHSADLDGHASGAVVKYFMPNVELCPINYGQQFPWERIRPNEIIYLVDFSLQPWDQMERLNQACCGELIWIDHHQTAIDEWAKAGAPFGGIREVGTAACVLAWRYFAPDIKVPRSLELLSLYDVWQHEDSEVLPFQYRLRMEETMPSKEAMLLWRGLLEADVLRVNAWKRLPELIEEGKLLLRYEEQQNKKFAGVYTFGTTFQGLRAICCNRGFTNSKVFDSVYDPEKHDLMITFCRLPLPKKKWTVSLYSTKPEIDVGILAKTMGGGGHAGASGFQCEELPFEV